MGDPSSKASDASALRPDQSMPLDPMFKTQDPKKKFWVPSEMAERYDREFFLLTKSREMLIFIIFLIAISIAALSRVNLMAFYMTHAIQTQLETSEYRGGVNNRIRFYDMKTVDEFWNYMEEVVSKVLYSDNIMEKEDKISVGVHDKGILFYNKLVGTPTIRELIVKNNTCKIHPKFKTYFTMCYSSYSFGTKSRDTMSGGTRDPRAYKHQLNNQYIQATTYFGKLGIYDNLGYHLRLGRAQETTLEKIRGLKAGGWLRKETRVIFVSFNFYNPNVDLFCTVKMVFEFPAIGGVIPLALYRTFNCKQRHGDLLVAIGLGCEFALIGFCLYFIAQVVMQCYYLRQEVLGMFWFEVDVLIILLLLIHLITFLLMRLQCNQLVESFQKNPATYHPMHIVSLEETLTTNTLALALFVSILKIFKYMSLNVITGQINNTLRKCGRHLFGFTMMFVLVFLAFAEFGYIVFGTQVTEFSTLGIAMFTLLRTILGDFTYTEIEKVHRHLAPFYFVLFIFLVFFVLLNMFLAIINDTYTDVKTEMAIAPDQMQMFEFWQRGFVNCCNDCGCKNCCPGHMQKRNEYNATAEQIRYTLKNCGFSDLDIDMFMARYNIDPAEQVQVRDVSKLIEALRQPPTEAVQRKPTAGQGPQQAPKAEKKVATAQPLMALEEFAAQQDRLDRVENIMALIAEKLERLLKKINTLGDIRKY